MKTRDEYRMILVNGLNDMQFHRKPVHEILNELLNPIYSPEPKEEVQESKPAIGKLTKPFGIKGYDTAEIGHNVFEQNDRYIIYLFKENTDDFIEVPFYKETLKSYIKFND